MKLIDTHCHPQFSQYDADREQIIQMALQSGVGMICVGTDLEMSRKAVELAGQYEGMWASVGLHPNDDPSEKYSNDEYRELAKHPKVIAIGEVGLDYFRTSDDALKKLQKERFEKQIGLAIEIKKPLIIHCRDPLRLSVGEASAHADMLELLRHHSTSLLSSPGVIHSFTGTYDDAKRYVELGFHIGLNGIITFARDYDETVQNIPVDNILLETDAPYLTPVPHRGKRNEPVFVLEVARKIAELRGVSIDELSSKITENTKRLFRL